MSTHENKALYMATLGCPKNRVDSEVMLGTLGARGYTLVERPEDAAVIVVNTCAFIGPAKQESVDTILELAELKKTGRCSTLVVTGCLSQRYGPELAKEMPEVDHFLGTGAYVQIGDLLGRVPADHPRPALRPRRPHAEGQLKPEVDRVPQDLRGLRQRLRLLHHPHPARRATLTTHRRPGGRGAHPRGRRSP